MREQAAGKSLPFLLSLSTPKRTATRGTYPAKASTPLLRVSNLESLPLYDDTFNLIRSPAQAFT